MNPGRVTAVNANLCLHISMRTQLPYHAANSRWKGSGQSSIDKTSTSGWEYLAFRQYCDVASWDAWALSTADTG